MNNIQTVILCGGVGYRLKEETEFRPKPMVEVGGKPIIWHILKIYSHFGFKDFIIALGYKGNVIKDYFVNKKYYDDDFILNTKTNRIKFLGNKNGAFDDFRITFVDTGQEALTGERVRRVKKYIRQKYFMITYGDGLADINLKDLVKFHIKHKKIATVSAVYPTLKYGGFKNVSTDDKAGSFEKRAKMKHLINGGYMVFGRKVLDMIKPDSMIEDIFDPLIKTNQLHLYRHTGFFHAMDTYQDMQDLNEMWRQNPAWKIWR